MTVKEVIKLLSEYDESAEVKIVDKEYVGHSIKHYGYGYSDGCTKEHCQDVTFIFKEVEENNEEEN